MIYIDLAISSLLGFAVIFSVIELGLTSYVRSLAHRSFKYYTPSDPKGYYLSNGGAAGSEINYILFCSVWTLLVAAIVFVLILGGNRVRRGVGSWTPALMLAFNAFTMIFWLAAFAAYAHLFMGFNASGDGAAILAFAVLNWLVFVALLAINIMTSVSIVRSEHRGWSPLSKRTRAGPTMSKI